MSWLTLEDVKDIYPHCDHSVTEIRRFTLANGSIQIRRVLERANHVCEGCGVNAATEVHHKTYKNVGNEFLFELVAICRPCHQRYHADDEGDTNAN